MALFTEHDFRRIEQAITELEAGTAAEFVVAVVPRARSYVAWRALATAAWTLGAALVGALLLPLAPFWLVLLQVPFALAAWLVLGWAPLARGLIPKQVKADAVQARAFELFARRGVHATAERTGILLLVSEFERRVELLGDRGIHARIGDQGWAREVALLIEHIRSGKPADGVVQVLGDLANLLARRVPRSPGDQNELPNQVLREQ